MGGSGRVCRLMARWLDDISLLLLLTIFVLLVVLFGAFYTFMTPSENGVIQSNAESGAFDFYSGLYFSIVTVSSLGYGDMYPVGLSKVAATIEVLLGLGLVGIMIAKLASRTLSHLVSRLFVSATRERLKEFEELYDKSVDTFRDLLYKISDTYQTTPGSKRIQANRDTPIDLFAKAIKELRTACSDLFNYVSAETTESAFFRLVPETGATKLADSIERAFFALSQCVISLPVSSNPDILDDILNARNRRIIAECIDFQIKTCNKFTQSKRCDVKIVNSFGRVRDVCEQVSGSYHHTPEQLQPDQILIYASPEEIRRRPL